MKNDMLYVWRRRWRRRDRRRKGARTNRYRGEKTQREEKENTARNFFNFLSLLGVGNGLTLSDACQKS